jgi:hypothetical protein
MGKQLLGANNAVVCDNDSGNNTVKLQGKVEVHTGGHAHSDASLLVTTDTERSANDGPDFNLVKNSVPNDSDYLGAIRFMSLDAGNSATRTYGEIDCFVRDADDGAADGSVIISTLSHGALTQGLKVRSTNNGASADVEVQVNQGSLIVGTSNSEQGVMTVHRGGSSAPGYIILYSPNGTANYIFCEDDGTLKRHTSAPTQISDGTAIGDQTD